MKYCFNIMLTEKCNARCTHCYMGECLKPKNLTKQQLDKIVEKLPKETEKIVLTGGEIFIEKELLMYTIDIIKEKLSNTEIELESNGIYFYNDDTEKKLKELNNKINAIRFSDDPFHEEGGVNLEKVRQLREYEKLLNYKIKYLVQDKALAVGRATNLVKTLQAHSNCMNSEKTLRRPYFFLDIYGNVYLCPWKITPAIGNIFSDPINSIINKLEEPFNKKVLVGKIEEAFSLKNKKINIYTEFTKENGQCALCKKVYNI